MQISLIVRRFAESMAKQIWNLENNRSSKETRFTTTIHRSGRNIVAKICNSINCSSRDSFSHRFYKSSALSILFATTLASCSSLGSSSSANSTVTTVGGSKQQAPGNTVVSICPSSTALSLLTGSHIPEPQEGNFGNIPNGDSCRYFDAKASAVVLEITVIRNYTVLASTLKNLIAGEANSVHATLETVSGLGNAAYEYTTAQGSSTVTNLSVISGATEISILANDTFVPNVQSVARYMLKH